ncbi:hypothetical protein F4677DRAFT_141090 [Hypoxylon crocopeplum]|nr:hypothetical protein F4677DRAFT_141090 [Hypoxylon crocopeplum]
MSTISDSDAPSWNPKPTPADQRLMKWKFGLRFEIAPMDGPTCKVVGIIDGGSKYCLISSDVAKSLGLEVMPIRGEAPILEGFEDVLQCQPKDFTRIKIKQSDLGLDTDVLSILVVENNKIPLLLGSLFNQKYDVEVKISNAVKSEIDPQDWDKSYVSGNFICVLLDSRPDGKQSSSPSSDTDSLLRDSRTPKRGRGEEATDSDSNWGYMAVSSRAQREAAEGK